MGILRAWHLSAPVDWWRIGRNEVPTATAPDDVAGTSSMVNDVAGTSSMVSGSASAPALREARMFAASRNGTAGGDVILFSTVPAGLAVMGHEWRKLPFAIILEGHGVHTADCSTVGEAAGRWFRDLTQVSSRTPFDTECQTLRLEFLQELKSLLYVEFVHLWDHNLLKAGE
jgi:hypothetical protein